MSRKAKPLYALKPGTVFGAQILDIRTTYVQIRLPDDSVFSAKIKTAPQARIGQVAMFVVKKNDYNGRIHLEILPPAPTRGANDSADAAKPVREIFDMRV